jgi:Reverse transcriptase (RNA-dependent DNA polymerase)
MTVSCNFIGYAERSRWYKFYDPTNRIIFETNAVKFYEDVMVQRGNINQIVFEESHDSPIQEAPTSISIIIRISGDSLIQNPMVNERIASEHPKIEENSKQDDVDVEEEPIPPQKPQEAVPLRRSTRERRSAISNDYIMFLQENKFNIDMMEDDPLTLRHALENVNSHKWIKVMDEEIKSMYDNKVWDIVPLPEGVKPIGCKWIFKTKNDSEGNVQRYKVRLVAKRFTHKKYIDFTESLSPVSMKDSFRIIMTLVTHFDLELHQMNVKIAFLYGDIDECIYITTTELRV